MQSPINLASPNPPVAVVSGAAYMVSVSIRVGKCSTSFDPSFFKGAALAQRLKDNGINSREFMPIYEYKVPYKAAIAGRRKSKNSDKFSLTLAGQTLSNRLDPIQEANMLCSGSKRWWFYPEMAHSDVTASLDQLENGTFDSEGKLILLGRKQLLEELKENYEAAKSLYLDRITNVLEAADRADKFQEYADRFPCIEELENNFRIEIEGPIRVPSVGEIASQTPEIRAFLNQIKSQMQRDLPEWVGKASAAIAAYLIRWDTCDPEFLTTSQSSSLNDLHSRLNNLGSLYNAMDFPDAHPASGFVQTCLGLSEGITDKTSVREKLDEIRNNLLSQDWVLMPASKGAKDLSRWCGVASLEDRLKDFKAQVEALEDLEPEQKAVNLAGLQRRARSFSGVLTKDLETLLNSVNLDCKQVDRDNGLIEDQPEIQIEDQLENKVEESVAEEFEESVAEEFEEPFMDEGGSANFMDDDDSDDKPLVIPEVAEAGF